MLAFSQWIATTPLSVFIDGVLWLIPTVQTLHILSLALLFSSIGAVALASFGRFGRAVPLAELSRRFAPWVWGALIVLTATGLILIIGEPVRELMNWAFWIKMPLVLIAALFTALMLSRLGRSHAVGDAAVQARARAPAVALVLLWCLVIVFGRLVAYAQLDV